MCRYLEFLRMKYEKWLIQVTETERYIKHAQKLNASNPETQ